MTQTSSDNAGKSATTPADQVLVWDAPVRVFHWLLALCFGVAYVTAEGEHWRLVHITAGYTFGGLVVFRLVWGIIGTRYARFANFVRSPAATIGYLRSLLQKAPAHYIGHNPAGAVAIVLFLTLGLVQLVTGWASYNEVGGDWISEVHEIVGNVILAIVGVHLLGVISASVLHGENLVRAMFTGKKKGTPTDAISRAWVWLAVVMVLVVALFWWNQWRTAPVPEASAASAQSSSQSGVQTSSPPHSAATNA